MRDILFRGMTRKPGERVKIDGTPLPGNWAYGGIFPGDGDFSVIYQREPIEKFSVYSDTIGQYTGLCDKNGVKIFEGDIVKSGDKLYTVDWYDYCARFVFTSNTIMYQPDFPKHEIHEKNVEVIGNIYENKELLEGGE